MTDELLDIVDRNNNVIGTKWRREVYADGDSNFRAVNVFIINNRGELWVPRRVATKKLFPLCLDASAAGHVASGESYEETFVREVMEEINLDVATVPHRLLGRTTPHDDGTSCFVQAHLIEMNETPNYNRDDFFESFWLTPQALLERLAAGDISKTDLPVLVKKFFPRASTA